MKIKLNNKIIKNLFVVAIALLGLSWTIFSYGNSYAEGKAALVVTPMSQKIILVPGETYDGTIEVLNSANSESALEFEVSIGSYSPTKGTNTKDDYGGVDVNNRSEHNIMMDWLTIDKQSGLLSPNEKATVVYSIKVPKNAPTGAQYASILVSQKMSDKSTTSSTIENKFQLASIIYANVAGETIEKGIITENSMPSILTTNKLEATSMVRNEGNIYADANYTLQVWPLFSDEELCTNEEEPENSVVLPDTERYHIQSCDLPMVGIFKAKQAVSIFGEQSILEKTIIVCPVWLMALIFIIIISIVTWLVIRIKMRKKAED